MFIVFVFYEVIFLVTWMHPSANIIDRAELHRSAMKRSLWQMSKHLEDKRHGDDFIRSDPPGHLDASQREHHRASRVADGLTRG